MSSRSRQLVNMALQSKNVDEDQIDIINCPIVFGSELFPPSVSPATNPTAIIMEENSIMNNCPLANGHESNLSQNLNIKCQKFCDENESELKQNNERHEKTCMSTTNYEIDKILIAQTPSEKHISSTLLTADEKYNLENVVITNVFAGDTHNCKNAIQIHYVEEFEEIELPMNTNNSFLEDTNKKNADINSNTDLFEIQEGQDENEDNMIEIVNSHADNENIIENEERIDENITEHENFETLTPRQRVKSQDVDRKNWKPNANKRKRELGMPYQGKIKTTDSWKYDVNKPGKFLAAPCKCVLGNKKTTVLKCFSVSKNEREFIFKNFWSKYTWSERKIYVQGLAKIEGVKRRRSNEEVSKRSFTVKYFLKIKNQCIRVCKKMFLGTLGMKETTILNWIKEDTGDEETEKNGSDNISRVRKQRFEESNKNLKEFLASLPKLESHYCRSSSSKLYIEPLWSSTNEMYRFYKNTHCVERNITVVSKTKFFVMFQKMNLSIYTPKKDLCDICVAYDTKNLSEEKYQEHQELKREARQEKERDKTSAEDFVFTMDLQSVLLCPKSTVSAMYYKTKLIVHNFTIYDLKTHDGYCFLWNESEGGLTANEFSSILVHFIEKEVIPKVTSRSQNIILYSDGCTGQNRNSILANALLNLTMIHDVTIIQKYLQKGHTQMEVDSMHSCIEKKVRNYKINVPADYQYLCKIARRSQPYKVEYLYHNFFKKYDNLKYYSSIRPGKVAGDAVVTNIKALKYNKDGQIHYKLRHTAEWQILGQRFKASPPDVIYHVYIPKEKKSRLKNFNTFRN